MKKINISLCLAIAYAAFWLGMACNSVGELPKHPNEPFSAWLPFYFMCLIVPPFMLGWAACNENKSED